MKWESKLSDDIGICSLDKNSLFGGEFIKCNPLLNNARNQMIIANLRSKYNQTLFSNAFIIECLNDPSINVCESSSGR